MCLFLIPDSAGSGWTFGIPIGKCIANDVELHRRKPSLVIERRESLDLTTQLHRPSRYVQSPLVGWYVGFRALLWADMLTSEPSCGLIISLSLHKLGTVDVQYLLLMPGLKIDWRSSNWLGQRIYQLMIVELTPVPACELYSSSIIRQFWIHALQKKVHDITWQIHQ